MTHQWMHATMQAVAAIVDPETGDVCIFSQDDPDEVTGCDLCNLPLTAENMEKPCIAVDAPAPAA